MTITKDEIAKFDFDRKGLVNRIIDTQINRDLIIDWITTDPNIMVYYQCFYLLQDATELKPQLFVNYWNTFAGLLDHKNSYHRDIGYTILANLICVDSKNNFDIIRDKYFDGIYDEKFKTAVSCINNLNKVAKIRNDIIDILFEKLLQHNINSKYPKKQEEYINGEIAKVFDSIFEKLNTIDKKKAEIFIYKNMKSDSPKTRKLCKEIVKRRNITTAST